jgi:DNA-directed RNA polymerase specialized sigma24 family protein
MSLGTQNQRRGCFALPATSGSIGTERGVSRGEDQQVPLESVRSEIDKQMPRNLDLPFDPALAMAINKRLSPQQREVVACHVLAGLSIRTTADVLGTSTGNVRSQLYVALHRLRDELHETEEVT